MRLLGDPVTIPHREMLSDECRDQAMTVLEHATHGVACASRRRYRQLMPETVPTTDWSGSVGLQRQRRAGDGCGWRLRSSCRPDLARSSLPLGQT